MESLTATVDATWHTEFSYFPKLILLALLALLLAFGRGSAVVGAAMQQRWAGARPGAKQPSVRLWGGRCCRVAAAAAPRAPAWWWHQ
jgi:hypothetical protein